MQQSRLHIVMCLAGIWPQRLLQHAAKFPRRHCLRRRRQVSERELPFRPSSNNANTDATKGQCKGSSTIKEIGSWIQDHKPLVIGIACGVGGLLLLSILSCIIRRCRRPRQPRRTQPMPMPMQQGWGGGPMPQGPWISGAQQSGRGVGGGGGGQPPWGGYPPHHGYQQPSVRYA